ncbi:scarecrow-like protein 28 [Hordeum vulgare]|nr:scarecrow-like protein 28 [Hordeum vulgare]
MFAREIRNAVAYEGPDRSERHERFAGWRRRMEDGDLLGVQSQLRGELHLARRLQLMLLPEAHLQELRLLVAQPLLLGRIVPSTLVVCHSLPRPPSSLSVGLLLLFACMCT